MSDARTEIAVLAFGDRLKLIGKIGELLKNPALRDFIGKIIGFIGTPEAAKIWDFITKFLDLLNAPKPASEADLEEQLASLLCSSNVSEADLDNFLRNVA